MECGEGKLGFRPVEVLLVDVGNAYAYFSSCGMGWWGDGGNGIVGWRLV